MGLNAEFVDELPIAFLLPSAIRAVQGGTASQNDRRLIYLLAFLK